MTETTLRLGRFDSHGITRARHDGRWLEVEHGIPGELVAAEVTGGKRPRATIRHIFEPDSDRVEPPCRFFRDWACGGCQWQHIDYPGQLKRKTTEVEEAMRRAGIPLVVGALHTLEEAWRYRSTVGISLGKSAGFRRHGSLAIVPIDDCPIAHPLIGQLMARLNAALQSGSLPDFRGRTRLDVLVVEEDSAPRLHVSIRPADVPGSATHPDVPTLAGLLSSLPEVAAVLIVLPNGEISAFSGPLLGSISVRDRRMWVSAAAFFQTNVPMLARLIDRLDEEITGNATRRIGDIYGGTGVIGISLAGPGREVVIVESDPIAVEAGRRTILTQQLPNVTFVRAHAEQALQVERELDAMVLDPPRTGLTPAVVSSILRNRPSLLLYISCLASSLARDLQQLIAGGYVVDRLELFDFYPQTYHVELLAVLRPVGVGGGG